MKDDLLHSEGPIFSILDKIGRMILLSIFWIVGSVPIVTAASSATALYYAIVKSVRREYGAAHKEFWKSYRANLRRGIPITVIGLLLAALLYGNIRILSAAEQGNNLLLWGSIVLLALLGAMAVYICPILSRFSMKAFSACRLAFVMAIRFFPVTILLAGGTVLLVYLQIFLLPMPTALVLPSLWCLCTSFPMERILRKYMPPKEENDNSWYYQ